MARPGHLQTIAEKHRTISGRGRRPRHDVQWNANEAVDRLICFAFAASATTTYVRVWFTESGRLGGARIATHQPGEDVQPVLDVKNLKVYYFTPRGPVKAVDGVDFNLARE